MKRKICSILLVVTALFVFAGCGPSAKTFTNDGISIMANDDFKQTTKDGHALYLESDYATISVKREKMADLTGLDENSPLRDYTNSVISNNSLNDVTAQNFGGTGGYDYFSYDKNENNNDLTYFVTTAKGTDSFYLVTMQSKKADYKNYEENFKTWAKSLKFDLKNGK
ncbi:MAG: hypothetical protein IKA90_00015 [Clostridia bacterium]|nr:hypothetical protein [Clostridia bacterium]